MAAVENGSPRDDDLGSGRLLRDIEEISKALYLHSSSSRRFDLSSDHQSKSVDKTHLQESNAKYVSEQLLQNGKKSSIWNWKPLKALTHIRNHRCSCYFFLHVHSIDQLPVNFKDLHLLVHWKRKDVDLRTRSASVSEGTARFEETLMHRCSVYVRKSGPHDNLVRYEPKIFLLHASVVGASGLDIGKHLIDLTRLLPVTLEELDEERKSSGKWTTSFKLAGKAKGGVMNVSFGFSLSGDHSFGPTNFQKATDLLKGNETRGNGKLQRTGSVPHYSTRVAHIPSLSLDGNLLNDVSVLPNRGSEIAQSISFLYEKLDEAKLHDSEEFKLSVKDIKSIKSRHDPCIGTAGDSITNEAYCGDSNVTDQGVEIPGNDHQKIEEEVFQTADGSPIEIIDVDEIFKGDETALAEEFACASSNGILKDENVVNDSCYGENDVSTEVAVEELEYFFHNLSISDSIMKGFYSNESEKGNNLKVTSSREGRMEKSHSFDDVAESVANDFMSLLAMEDSLPLLGSDSEPESPRECLLRQFEKEALVSGNPLYNFDPVAHSDDLNLSILNQGAEMEHTMAIQSSKRKAEMIENSETEALMQEWGLSENAFQNSPLCSPGAFGSPVYLHPEEPPELPVLGQGLGSILRTKGDGFLRSMNPSLFKSARNGESLIMQVSSSVVLPPAMGSNVMDILQRWALVGAERMFFQANELMPLEDITGKTLQQVAWEAEPTKVVLGREYSSLHESYDDKYLILRGSENEMDPDYVSLKDLAPLAMDKIQALLIEGLRIQSGMSSEEAPSTICVQSTGEALASSIRSMKLGGSSTFGGGLEDIDEILRFSISLDELVKLDSGVVGDESEIADKHSKIISFHGPDKLGKVSEQHCGYLDKNFTIALRVLLRDPFRDYEPIGTSMLALVHVERNFVSGGINVKVGNNEEGVRFKITEVHLAGLKAETGIKPHSGIRWLQSSGMGKMKKPSFLQSNAIVRSSSQLIRKIKHEDTLWSISSYVQGSVGKWKELSALDLCMRNPDIVFK